MRTTLISTLLMFPALACAQDPSRGRELFEAYWFFGVMLVALIVLGALRIRDRALPKEERLSRAKKRLPFAIGAIVMAIAPILFD